MAHLSGDISFSLIYRDGAGQPVPIEPMETHDATQPTDSGEVFIERTITFRNSTFGGLKAYIRGHKRRTGIELTNSAAVDMLLRYQLAVSLPRGAAREFHKLTRPAAFFALQAVPSADTIQGPPRGTERSESNRKAETSGSTRTARTSSMASRIAVEMPTPPRSEAA